MFLVIYGEIWGNHLIIAWLGVGWGVSVLGWITVSDFSIGNEYMPFTSLFDIKPKRSN